MRPARSSKLTAVIVLALAALMLPGNRAAYACHSSGFAFACLTVDCDRLGRTRIRWNGREDFWRLGDPDSHIALGFIVRRASDCNNCTFVDVAFLEGDGTCTVDNCPDIFRFQYVDTTALPGVAYAYQVIEYIDTPTGPRENVYYEVIKPEFLCGYSCGGFGNAGCPTCYECVSSPNASAGRCRQTYRCCSHTCPGRPPGTGC